MDFYNTTHISYNNAGIDTDTIVQKLMQAEQVPLDQLKQKQQKDTWLSDAYRQWNTDIFNFNNQTVYNMKMSSSFDTFNVTSSQTSAVTATGSANAIQGTYTLAVNKIAQSATLTGQTKFKSTDDLLKDAQGNNIPGTNSDGSMDINISISNNDPTNSAGTQQTATVHIPKDATISDVVTAFNTATDSSGKSLGMRAIYDPTLQQFILKTNSTGSVSQIDLTNNSSSISNFLTSTLGLSNYQVTGNPINMTNPVTTNSTNNNNVITLNGINLTINGTFTTAQDYVDQINKQIGADPTLQGKIVASIDQNNNLQFTSATSFTVSGTAPGVPSTSTTSQNILKTTGNNADITFNGTRLTNLASNNVSLLGVSYTLNSTTDPTTNGATISVNRDVDTEVKNIENFISSYNDILGKLNSAISEPVYSDYQPLTDDQRSQMTDTQIQQWETKAKSGLMNNDNILSGLVTNMRNAMISSVNNGSTYNSLASIGITSHSYQDQGKLYVNEDQLRTALQNDPDGVQALFNKLGDGVGNQQGKQGIMQSLSDSLNNAFQQLVNKAGSPNGSQLDQSFLGQDLTSLSTQINDMTTKLQAKETSYYQQYDAMQQAVSNYQSQGSWLSQQLGLSTTTTG